MKVKEFKKKEKCAAELSVEIEPQELEAAANKVYIQNRKKFNIPGFRKGKVPRKILEGMYGADLFYDDAINELANDAYSFCVKEYNLTTTGQPTFADYTLGEDKSATLVFKTDLYPEITLTGDYKGIKAPKSTSADVTEDEVNKQVETIRSQNVRIETVDREAKINDVLNISFVGLVDDVPFDGGSADNEDLELGSGNFVAGFEDQLVGHRAGDFVKVNITFPEDYFDKNLAGKDAVFEVTVHEVKEKILPELNDDFAMDVSEYDTLEEYKASIRENIRQAKEDQNEREFEEAISKNLAKLVEGEIPESMIESQLEDMINNFHRNLQAQGIPLDSIEDSSVFSSSVLKEQLRPEAERMVKRDLAIEKIAELENIEISDDDIEKQYETYANIYKQKIENIKQAISRDSIITSVKLKAAADLVHNSAIPVDPELYRKENAEADSGAESSQENPEHGVDSTEAGE